MIVKNEFVVPLAADAAWRSLLDVRAMSNCIPGGELKEVIDDRTFKGTIRVRLGPILAIFDYTAHIESIDAPAMVARVRATGSDIKGRGSAAARAQVRVGPSEDGSKVLVETDLQLAGMIAQYGRASGVITQLAQQLANEFADNLRRGCRPDEIGFVQSQATITSHSRAPVTTAPAKEVSVLSLLWRMLINRLRRAVRSAWTRVAMVLPKRREEAPRRRTR